MSKHPYSLDERLALSLALVVTTVPALTTASRSRRWHELAVVLRVRRDIVTSVDAYLRMWCTVPTISNEVYR
jgi:hypothetical protein